MSLAHKCDKCDRLYPEGEPGSLRLSVALATTKIGFYHEWQEVELCGGERCGEAVVGEMIPALTGVEHHLKKRNPKRAAGGHARAAKMSAEQRTAQARAAAKARWRKS